MATSEGRRSRQRGGTVVEFAVIAPLLLLLMFGIIETSRLIFGFTGMWTAAREGARFATTVGDDDSDGIPNYLDCDGIIAAALARVSTTGVEGTSITVTFDDGAATVADCDASDSTFDDPVTAATNGQIPNGTSVVVGAEGSFRGVAPFVGELFNGIDLGSVQSRSIFRGKVGT